MTDERCPPDERGHFVPAPILRTAAEVKRITDFWDRVNRLHEQMPRLDLRRMRPPPRKANPPSLTIP